MTEGPAGPRRGRAGPVARRPGPRLMILAVLPVALAACGEPPRESQKAAASPAALQFDGADYRTAAEKLAHGKRMARVLACLSCHGETLQGANATADDPDFGDMNAPNISLLLPTYSDEELERVIRAGVPKDKRSFWFMASESFQFLGDRDLEALIAWLRTVRPGGKPMPPIRRGPGFYRAMKTGEMQPAADLVRRFREEQPADLGPEHAFGRRLAQTVCAECHNSRLQGYPDFTPDLDVAGAYSTAGLERLLTTGESLTGRDLGLMAQTVRIRLKDLTPNERGALIRYLKARAAWRSQPAPP